MFVQAGPWFNSVCVCMLAKCHVLPKLLVQHGNTCLLIHYVLKGENQT